MEYININHLKYFYYVAKFNSYTKAANYLHIQQPALSKTVKNLEYDLGLILFEKDGRGIQVSQDGEYILSKCEDIFGKIQEIINFSQDTDIPLKSTFSIYTNDALSSLVLPSLLNQMNLNSKGMRPFVEISSFSDIKRKFKKNREQVALLFYTPHLEKDLVVVKKIKVPFELVIAKRYQSSEKVISSFIGSREVESEDNVQYPTVELMRKTWPNTKITNSSNSLLAHLEFVKQGMGVSLLPKFLVENELRSGVLTNVLPNKKFSFNLKVITRIEKKDDPIVKELINHLEKLLK